MWAICSAPWRNRDSRREGMVDPATLLHTFSISTHGCLPVGVPRFRSTVAPVNSNHPSDVSASAPWPRRCWLKFGEYGEVQTRQTWSKTKRVLDPSAREGAVILPYLRNRPGMHVARFHRLQLSPAMCTDLLLAAFCLVNNNEMYTLDLACSDNSNV